MTSPKLCANFAFSNCLAQKVGNVMASLNLSANCSFSKLFAHKISDVMTSPNFCSKCLLQYSYFSGAYCTIPTVVLMPAHIYTYYMPTVVLMAAYTVKEV